MKFPAWIPEWVKNELSRLSDDEIAALFWSPEMPIWITQAIQSEKMKNTWRRLGEHDFNDKWDEGRLSSLLQYIEEGLSGFERNKMTKAERVSIANSIQALSLELSNKIEFLAPRSGKPKWAHYFFNSRMSDFADKHVSEGLDRESKIYFQDWPKALKEHAPEVLTEGVEGIDFIDNGDVEFTDIELGRALPAIRAVSKGLVREAIWGDLPLMLRHLAETAKAFSEYPQFIAMPNHPNAGRLFFIRTITGFFLEFYERPLRKECLALTEVFFDCSDIEESDLSRLAPVSKYKNGRFNAGE